MMNLKLSPYPLLERSESPGDKIHHLAGDEAGQDGGGGRAGDRRPLGPEAPQVPEGEEHI